MHKTFCVACQQAHWQVPRPFPPGHGGDGLCDVRPYYRHKKCTGWGKQDKESQLHKEGRANLKGYIQSKVGTAQIVGSRSENASYTTCWHSDHAYKRPYETESESKECRPMLFPVCKKWKLINIMFCFMQLFQWAAHWAPCKKLLTVTARLSETKL